MCTLSVIRIGEVTRVVMSRDELRTRPRALPPRRHEIAGPARTAVWPIDPQGGGTWIGARDDGVVLALLNATPSGAVERVGSARSAPQVARSRGEIIPRLLGTRDGEALIAMVNGLPLSDYAPFRLAVIEDHLRVLSWDGARLQAVGPVAPPACVASSGLGDHLAQDRLPLFDELVRASPSSESQDAFHGHAWPDRPEVSVLMARNDARTVSVTSVEVDRTGGGAVRVRMDYRDVPE